MSEEQHRRRMLRISAIVDKTGLSAAVIRREQAAGRFPKFRQLSPQCVGCFEDEVDDWLAARPLAGDPSLSATVAGPGRGHRGSRKSKPAAAAEAAP
jgi:prophage regulatory protein